MHLKGFYFRPIKNTVIACLIDRVFYGIAYQIIYLFSLSVYFYPLTFYR